MQQPKPGSETQVCHVNSIHFTDDPTESHTKEESLVEWAEIHRAQHSLASLASLAALN